MSSERLAQLQKATELDTVLQTLKTAVFYFLYIYIYIICTKENRLPTDKNFIQTLYIFAQYFAV